MSRLYLKKTKRAYGDPAYTVTHPQFAPSQPYIPLHLLQSDWASAEGSVFTQGLQ